jgi:hypothetical protein
MYARITLLDTPLDVHYAYYKARRGAIGDYGQPVEPDEPETVEIISVEIEGVDVLGLVEEHTDKIEELLLKQE